LIRDKKEAIRAYLMSEIVEETEESKLNTTTSTDLRSHDTAAATVNNLSKFNSVTTSREMADVASFNNDSSSQFLNADNAAEDFENHTNNLNRFEEDEDELRQEEFIQESQSNENEVLNLNGSSSLQNVRINNILFFCWLKSQEYKFLTY
jgi:hypothetical protein